LTVAGETSEAAVARVNAAAKQPVMFIHGLWLAARSWDAWAGVFERAGYVALKPPWPSDEGGDAGAETVGRVVQHYARLAEALSSRPAIVGHSFGGLIAQILAGRGLSAATVAIAPAPFRGVIPLPISALRSAWPVLHSPANAGRKTPLTAAQFRYAFGNAVGAAESQALFEEQAVPAPGRPLFQAAAANLNPWTEARVDAQAGHRGPLLIVAGERDHTVPPIVVRAAFERQKANRHAVSEYLQMPGRGHSLTIDSGWREVADTALTFIQRFV
jgi:pimeloyl-ACP methyl ester carboxylesterase